MSFYDTIISKLPGISEPKTYLSFKSRLKWTALILLLFLIMGQITLFGVAPVSRERFQFFELILGSSIGSLVTLGIGPIVTASIILQLLSGSGILGWDLKTTEGKKKFQGTQKLLAVFFSVFEAFAFVAFGAIQPASADSTIFGLLIFQLAFGALLLLFMDEVVSKWGIGSGVSLFIAAGVTKTIFVRAFSPIEAPGTGVPSGLVPQIFVYMGQGDLFQAAVAFLPILATILVFMIVIYVQAMKVEIPLAFGSIRGFSRRWPLKLIYTSNIPVILVAALIANIQLVGGMLARPTEFGSCGLLGCFDANGIPASGFVYFLQVPTSLPVQVFFLLFMAIVAAMALLLHYFRSRSLTRLILVSTIVGFTVSLLLTSFFVGLPTPLDTIRVITYLSVLVAGATMFSIFWVSTSGMDAKSVAEQIEGMGMQVPGFRRDPRIVEQVLNRYIPTLAIISGVAVGLLASLADFTNALGTGTGILLTVMIIYNFYEQISVRYLEDMHPSMRKFFE